MLKNNSKSRMVMIGLFLVLGLVLAGGLLLGGYKFGQSRQLRLIPLVIPTLRMDCQDDSDCILVLKKADCCHCPFAVNKTELAKNKDIMKYSPDISWSQIELTECKNVKCDSCRYSEKAICRNQTCMPVMIPTPSPTPLGYRCATYIRGDKKETQCATCGDGLCDEFERCISSFCSKPDEVDRAKCTQDCGGLYCQKDC